MWPMGLTFDMTFTFGFSRSNVTLTLDHTYGVDQGFSWSNFEIAESQNGRSKWVGLGHSWPWPWPLVTKIGCKDLPDSDRGDFRCWRAVESNLLNSCNRNRPMFLLCMWHYSHIRVSELVGGRMGAIWGQVICKAACLYAIHIENRFFRFGRYIYSGGQCIDQNIERKTFWHSGDIPANKSTRNVQTMIHLIIITI